MENTTFGQEIITHSHFLNAFARKLASDVELSQDLVQETIFKALANEDKFHGGNLRGWLSTIMRNIYINHLRKNRRNYVARDEREVSFLMENNTPSARNTGDSTIMMTELRQEIDQLHPDLKGAFLMRYEGFKYDEIAEHFSTPIGTIKSRIHLARKNLKNRLMHLYGSQQFAELAA